VIAPGISQVGFGIQTCYRMSRSKSGRNAQGGFSVMLALVIIALAVGSLAVTMLSTFGTKLRSERVTEAALAKAKEALIAYAATDPNRPGELPCPDTHIPSSASNGIADLLAGPTCAHNIGRLPWRTLGLPDLRDGAGEQLWYAVSENFHVSNATPPAALNSDTPGLLSLAATGITPATGVAAIIFAPGSALSGQDRSNQIAVGQYLEGVNATSDAKTTTTFIAENSSDTFDDRLITIRPQDIFRLVEKRVGPELRPMLAQYYANWGRYPFAVPFGDPSVSNFRGAVNTYEGLLPTIATKIVSWNATLSSMRNDLLPLPSLCTISPNQENLSCSTLSVALLGINSTLTITAIADNVGMAFVDPVPTGTVVASPALSNLQITQRILDSNGTAEIVVSGQLPIIFLGIPTVTITRPQPSSWLTTSWVTKNNWQAVSYYAVAPGYAPNGLLLPSCTPNANPCNPAGVLAATDCLSVCDARLPANLQQNNVRSMLVMTGPALSLALSHPSSVLSRYLEGGNQSVPDGTYETGLLTNIFNDQVSVLAPPP
jgi:hypothetical protein